jgi:hypothetical protein
MTAFFSYLRKQKKKAANGFKIQSKGFILDIKQVFSGQKYF